MSFLFDPLFWLILVLLAVISVGLLVKEILHLRRQLLIESGSRDRRQRRPKRL